MMITIFPSEFILSGSTLLMQREKFGVKRVASVCARRGKPRFGLLSKLEATQPILCRRKPWLKLSSKDKDDHAVLCLYTNYLVGEKEKQKGTRVRVKYPCADLKI
jgi:hypothetical protein